jgi:hypothetical protein
MKPERVCGTWFVDWDPKYPKLIAESVIRGFGSGSNTGCKSSVKSSKRSNYTDEFFTSILC